MEAEVAEEEEVVVVVQAGKFGPVLVFHKSGDCGELTGVGLCSGRGGSSSGSSSSTSGSSGFKGSSGSTGSSGVRGGYADPPSSSSYSGSHTESQTSGQTRSRSGSSNTGGRSGGREEVKSWRESWSKPKSSPVTGSVILPDLFNSQAKGGGYEYEESTLDEESEDSLLEWLDALESILTFFRRGSGGGGGRGSPSSSAGGRTTTGSGPAPAYAGGKYYGGGAAVPYKAGQPSRSGINPVLLGAGAAVAFWPGLWLYGAYMYPYTHHHSFYNASSKQNETKPVTCGCDPYQVCGCDENGDPQYLRDIVGNGTNLNSTLVAVGTVDGVQRILINGTLPNGTTAPGGDEDPNAGAGMHTMLHAAGWWPVVAIVSAMVLIV